MKDDFFLHVLMEQIYSASKAGISEIRVAYPTEEELDILKDYGELFPQKDDTWILRIYPSVLLDKEKSGE